MLGAAGVEEGYEGKEGPRGDGQLHVGPWSTQQVRDPAPEEGDHLAGGWMLSVPLAPACRMYVSVSQCENLACKSTPGGNAVIWMTHNSCMMLLPGCGGRLASQECCCERRQVADSQARSCCEL